MKELKKRHICNLVLGCVIQIFGDAYRDVDDDSSVFFFLLLNNCVYILFNTLFFKYSNT